MKGCSPSPAIGQVYVKTTLLYHSDGQKLQKLIIPSMVMTWNDGVTFCWWEECKAVQPLWEVAQHYPVKLETRLTSHPPHFQRMSYLCTTYRHFCHSIIHNDHGSIGTFRQVTHIAEYTEDEIHELPLQLSIWPSPENTGG